MLTLPNICFAIYQGALNHVDMAGGKKFQNFPHGLWMTPKPCSSRMTRNSSIVSKVSLCNERLRWKLKYSSGMNDGLKNCCARFRLLPSNFIFTKLIKNYVQYSSLTGWRIFWWVGGFSVAVWRFFCPVGGFSVAGWWFFGGVAVF